MSFREDFRPRAILQLLSKQDGRLLALVAVHAAAAFAVGVTVDRPFYGGIAGTIAMIFGLLLPLFLIVLLVARFIWMIFNIRTEKPLAWFIADIRKTVLDPDRLIGGTVAMLAFSAFSAAFSFIKSAIPALRPFEWDTQFAALDRALHAGHDPYVVLMQVFGHPWIITAINANYHFWLFLLIFVVFIACYSKERASRATFLVGFVLTWGIGGNLLAIVFSSAGPVYYQALGLGNDFTPLTEALRASSEISPVWALGIQEALWEGYTGDGQLRGISAMPSMHMASSVLLMMYGFRRARWAGWVLALFSGMILIGSVLLAWHYAIDSYAGAALAVICWKLAALLTGDPAAARSIIPIPAAAPRSAPVYRSQGSPGRPR